MEARLLSMACEAPERALVALWTALVLPGDVVRAEREEAAPRDTDAIDLFHIICEKLGDIFIG